MQIPSNSNFKSLNLSHSVIIIAQIVFNLINLNIKNYSKSKKVSPAKKKQIKGMLNLCIKNLENRINGAGHVNPKEIKIILIK